MLYSEDFRTISASKFAGTLPEAVSRSEQGSVEALPCKDQDDPSSLYQLEASHRRKCAMICRRCTALRDVKDASFLERMLSASVKLAERQWGRKLVCPDRSS